MLRIEEETIVVQAALDTSHHIVTGTVEGPASYPTGGFVVDLTAAYSQVKSVMLQMETLGSLPVGDHEVVLDSPTAGKATVKLFRYRFDRFGTSGGASNPPTGVTIATLSGQTSSSEAAHTHTIDHDHAAFTSGQQQAGGAASRLDGLIQTRHHTHNIDVPAFTGTSGAGSSHNHTDNTVYEHQHAATFTETDYERVEVANTTNLSNVRWLVCASGQRV